MRPAVFTPLLALLLTASSPGAERATADRNPAARKSAARKTAARNPRAEMEALRASLETSLRKAARPLTMNPRAAVPAYHLKGYGFMVVLSPRLLPAQRSTSDRAAARALTEAMRSLQQSLRRIDSGELRERIEESLRALKETHAHVQSLGEHEGRTVVRIEIPEISGPDLEDLEREMRDELAANAEVLRQVEREAFEQHAAAMQEQAEAFRREAERAREQAVREVWGRLRPPAAPATVAAPEPPKPPAPPAAPAAPEEPLPIEPLDAPPPPWRFWTEADEAPHGRTPEGVVNDVRQALVAGLQAHRGPLTLLGPEEAISVAVDFIPHTGRRSSVRTLIAHVRKKDIEDRRAGRLTPAEFAKRVVFEEY